MSESIDLSKFEPSIHAESTVQTPWWKSGIATADRLAQAGFQLPCECHHRRISFQEEDAWYFAVEDIQKGLKIAVKSDTPAPQLLKIFLLGKDIIEHTKQCGLYWSTKGHLDHPPRKEARIAGDLFEEVVHMSAYWINNPPIDLYVGVVKTLYYTTETTEQAKQLLASHPLEELAARSVDLEADARKAAEAVECGRSTIGSGAGISHSTPLPTGAPSVGAILPALEPASMPGAVEETGKERNQPGSAPTQTSGGAEPDCPDRSSYEDMLTSDMHLTEAEAAPGSLEGSTPVGPEDRNECVACGGDGIASRIPVPPLNTGNSSFPGIGDTVDEEGRGQNPEDKSPSAHPTGPSLDANVNDAVYQSNLERCCFDLASLKADRKKRRDRSHADNRQFYVEVTQVRLRLGMNPADQQGIMDWIKRTDPDVKPRKGKLVLAIAKCANGRDEDGSWTSSTPLAQVVQILIGLGKTTTDELNEYLKERPPSTLVKQTREKNKAKSELTSAPRAPTSEAPGVPGRALAADSGADVIYADADPDGGEPAFNLHPVEEVLPTKVLPDVRLAAETKRHLRNHSEIDVTSLLPLPRKGSTKHGTPVIEITLEDPATASCDQLAGSLKARLSAWIARRDSSPDVQSELRCQVFQVLGLTD